MKRRTKKAKKMKERETPLELPKNSVQTKVKTLAVVTSSRQCEQEIQVDHAKAFEDEIVEV